MSELAYFQRRLADAQRATELPPGDRFTLAASDMDDDTAEQTYAMFGGPEYGTGGFGMSDILNEFLSRDPKFVPVQDLAAYQQNLISTGYLPPTYPVTGVHDEQTHAASRRSERDMTDLIRSGAHLGSVTVGKGLGYLAAAVPQGIMQGVFAAAKGLVESAKDVATNPVQAVEEGGALGTGIAGAGIGAVVGGPVGAGIGFLGGVGLGLVADFFGDDEGEEGQSLVQNLWDSLSPWDEYKQSGAKHFFSLLDTVMLAGSVIKGAQIGVRGVQGALAAPSLAAGSQQATLVGGRAAAGMVLPNVAMQFTRTVAQAGFREAFRRAAPGTVAPGLAAKMTAGMLKRPIVGGAAIGGIIDAAPELLHGEFGEAVQHFAQGAVTGAVGFGVASKTKAGRAAIDRGLKLMDSAPLMRITESGASKVVRAAYTGFAVTSTGARITADITPGEDPTEKAIKHAPDWGTAGDVIDLTVGTFFYPSRILPLRPREIGDALRAMDNRHLLMPVLRAESKRLNRPIDDELIREVETKLGMGDPSDRVTIATNLNRMYLNKALNDEAKRLAELEMPEVGSITDRFKRASIERTKRAELVARSLEEAKTGPSAQASSLFEQSIDAPRAMQTHVESWEGRGTSIDNLVEEQKAQDVLDALSTQVTEGKAFRVMPALRDSFVTQQYVSNTAEAAAKNGLALGVRQRYEMAVTNFTNTRKVLDEATDNQLLKDQFVDAGDEVDKVLLEMRDRGLIEHSEYVSLRDFGNPKYGVDKKLTKRLDEVAELQPRENVEMSQMLEQGGLNRYIAVNTGENMLVTADIPRLLEYEGIGEVVRHPVREWFAAMARKPDEFHDLGPMRYWSIATHLGEVSNRLGLGLDDKQMADILYDYVKNQANPQWARKHLNQLVTTNKTGTVIYRQDVTPSGTPISGKRRELLKVDPRDLNLEDITKAYKLDELTRADGSPLFLDPADAADQIKRAAHVGAAFGADMMNPFTTLRELGRGLKIEGLPAFQNFARTARIPVHRWAPDEGFFAKAKKGSWGFVPSQFRRYHLAAQFTFNPAFDISRYLESMSFGMRHGISPRLVMNSRKFVRNFKDGFIDPMTGQRVFEDEALKAMDRFADHAIYGRNTMQSLDDLQYRVNNAGMAGFKPREVESAQALWLAQKYARKGPMSAADLDELREQLLTINRYGKGQSAWAKSAHFVFFPFLFQAKQLNLVQDVVLGAPARTALLHEGFRRWNGINEDPGLKEDFEKLIENHLPVIQELARWNNLSYGIGAGRFVFEGMLDGVQANGRKGLNKSLVGKITQGLTQFFLPGGIHTPVGESAGGLMDAARHVFAPVYIYEDGERVTPWDELQKLVQRSVPLYRDVQRWIDDNEGVFFEQVAAIGQPSHLTGQAQFSAFLDNRRMLKAGFEQIATSAGYSSWDSLRESDAGAGLKQLWEQAQDLLRLEYPKGQELAARFVDTDEIKKGALIQLANKEYRTEAEEAIVGLGLLEEEIKDIAEQRGVSQETMLRAVSPMVRQFALQYVNDPQFTNLWEAFFRSFYGPVRVVAA